MAPSLNKKLAELRKPQQKPSSESEGSGTEQSVVEMRLEHIFKIFIVPYTITFHVVGDENNRGHAQVIVDKAENAWNDKMGADGRNSSREMMFELGEFLLSQHEDITAVELMRRNGDGVKCMRLFRGDVPSPEAAPLTNDEGEEKDDKD
jgi:hypothetical protein